METFFISHGSPTLAIDDGLPARHFLRSWQGDIFPVKPKAVLVASAHRETAKPAVNVVARPDTIHDFFGFPEPMYQLKYPAPGAPELARQVLQLLKTAGFDTADEDEERGLDHGAWVPLMLMYPEADVPVCQLSVQPDLSAEHHYNMGRALAPLREEDVLIIGSGSATHNLKIRGPVDGPVYQWASDFDDWLEDSLLNQRHEDLNGYEEKGPHAKTAHPLPEHLYPLHVALGAAGPGAKAELLHRSWTHRGLSYSSYRFSTAP